MTEKICKNKPKMKVSNMSFLDFSFFFKFFLQGGAQHLLGPENPMKSVDFNGQGWGPEPPYLLPPTEYTSDSEPNLNMYPML